MLIQTDFDFEGRTLRKSYSDKGMLVRNLETGALYGEAVDPAELNRPYEETDIPIEDDISDAEALEIITGGNTDEQE